jgi:hypothetical protein
MLVTLLGVLLAFFFTIFPFPVTSRSILRQDVARQFHLLSNIYSFTQTRLGLAVTSEGSADSSGLRDLMGKAAFRSIALQGRCRENLGYTAWEPSFQTRFPTETYSELLDSMQR